MSEYSPLSSGCLEHSDQWGPIPWLLNTTSTPREKCVWQESENGLIGYLLPLLSNLMGTFYLSWANLSQPECMG